MSYFPYEFVGPIEAHDLGTLRYTVVWLPEEIAANLPFGREPRLRISGELGDQPFEGAWQPSRGRWYLMLGKPLLKAAGCAIGSVAEVRFRLEAQDEVRIDTEFERALAANPSAGDRWLALTPGKQRAIAHFLGSAKTAPTRSRRLTQAISWLVEDCTDLRQLPRMPI